MASQSLNTKGIEPRLTNLFHGNLGESFIPIEDIPNIMENHSPHTSHDEDDSLTQVTIDQLGKFDHELDRLQQWKVQEHSNSEAIPLI